MISFANYMQEWLYGKDGYYRKSIIGKMGDFYTSVSASKIFGGSIAWHIVKLLEQNSITLPLKIVEIGADKAHLIGDVAQFLYAISDGVIKKTDFITIEPLIELSEIQKTNFYNRVGLDLKTYEKIEDLHLDKNESVFVFANELFDSFACEVIDGEEMIFIDNHQVSWGDISSEVSFLSQKYNINKGEIPTGLEKFISSMVESLKKCKKWKFLTFDYGQWDGRNDINLRIYKSHQVKNFLEITDCLKDFYQKSDITYDVNFSLIDKIFTSFGAKRIFYGSQAKALIEMGVLDLLEKFSESVSYEVYLRESAKIKPLISPMGLGERFHSISFEGP